MGSKSFDSRKTAMKFGILVSIFLLVGRCLGRQRKGYLGGDEKELEKSHDRDGKLFSLFTIVNFKNVPCTSSISLASGSTQFRNGTCFTQSECSSKGGNAKGNCAAGFGVCCVFLYDSSSDTQVNYNDTYIQNPSYPSTYGESNSISYTVNKCSDDICWLRLDFETFTTLGPAATEETTGDLCVDTFTVTASVSTSSVPVICGDNTGQHIYVDIGNESGGTATLAFAFTGTSTARKWDIKVAQIPCGTTYGPRDGCLQWFTGLTGRITTFNFNTAAGPHLPNQNYQACVRREAGACCVEYSVCNGVDNAFTIDSLNTNKQAKAGNACRAPGTAAVGGLTSISGDYIEITGSGATCGSSAWGFYCGTSLHIKTEETASIPICDCTQPFAVGIHTDAIADADATLSHRGLCLDYRQLPCTNSIS